MTEVTDSLLSEITRRNKFCIPVVEIYTRATEDINSASAPGKAIDLFSNTCYTWTNITGSYTYKAKITGFPEVQSYIDGQLNSAEIEFSNVERGENSMSRFVLDNNIKGCWLVIRLLFPDSPEDSYVAFWGKCARPGEINNSTMVISATQDIGNSAQQIPFRSYQAHCPLEFARAGGGCLGDQTLDQKSVSYRTAVALYGTSGCNKTFSTCTLLANTNYFQGQRVVAVSGQFSYVTIEEVVKRVLFWTKRKKVPTNHSDNWSSVNQSEGNEIVPVAFGRCQIQGHPISWADIGTQVKSLQGFCEGRISAFTFIRSRTEGINIVSSAEHLGDWGNVGTQTPETLFNGVSGPNSRLAYLEILTNGSSPTQVDDAPIVTAVIRGLEVPVPDPTGAYTLSEWSNNPAHITRFVMSDLRFGRIPAYRFDDAVCIDTANDCDSIVEDRTNDEAAVLPANEAVNYGVGYRRFGSAGRVSAYKNMYDNGDFGDQPLVADPPEFQEPEVTWFNPFEPYTIPRNDVILRQKYTFNGAVTEKGTILDFLFKNLLPTYKGYISYAPNGKIQIKNRRKADNGYLRMAGNPGDARVAVSNIRPWIGNNKGYLLVGVSLEDAEVRGTTGFEYSTACNELPISATSTLEMTASTSGTMSGGSLVTPALGYIDIGGTVSPGASVNVTFNTGEDVFNVCYIADGVEDNPAFARMLCAFLNAHLQFQSYLTAYILDNNPTRILVRCESGYLLLDQELEFKHDVAEEVMRVQAVFENCGELTANSSARFDNIISDSFKWNTDNTDEVNAITAKYTSAIDDFHLTSLLPRAAWDTIDLEGELKQEELDLTFVDNYWQAAFLAKCEAIERIDGNLFFNFGTDLSAILLELGDVVAVRHDSGDGALNYVPVWITANKLDLDKFTVMLTAKLYLSAAHDLDVQPIDVLLTTTLNSALLPDVTPPTIGSNGGVSTSSVPNIVRPSSDTYYKQFGLSTFSKSGKDIV